MRLRHPRLPVPASILLPPRWRRNATALSAMIALSALIVCERTAQGPIQGSDRSRYHDRTFQVVYVVDGDTLDIDAPDADKSVGRRDRQTSRPRREGPGVSVRTRIRLWGVDTPELARSGRPEMHFAKAAKEFAEQTLRGKEVNVVLVEEKTRDKYGRLLAYIFCERGGRMFNEMLLEEGFAYADPRFVHPYKKQFASTEQRARKNGVGLWSGVTIDQMPAWKQRRQHRHTSRPRREGLAP